MIVTPSNVITSSQRHRRAQRFREQRQRRNDQSRPQRFPVNRHANKSGPRQALSSKSHVQTARESHDLNMDFLRLHTASRNEFPCKNLNYKMSLTNHVSRISKKANKKLSNRTKP